MTLNRWLGLFALAASLMIVFVWIPLDVETGIIEKVRRQKQLGDAFAPFVAALIIGLGGFITILEKPARHSANPSLIPPGWGDIKHILFVGGILLVSLLLIRYTGPLLVKLFRGDAAEYRLLRDTMPWKYAGFVVGGVCLISALIAYAERRLRFRHILIALLAVFAMIAVYDLPFDDLLLPPNGDV